MIKYIFILSLTFTSAVLVVSCHQKETTTEEVINESAASEIITISSTQFEKSGYQIGKMALKKFNTQLNVSGMVHLPEKNMAIVSSYVGGTLGDVNLVPGQQVRKGQILFTITNPDLINWQQELMESRAQLSYLNEEYKREKSLADENISAKKNYLKAESEFRVMETKLAAISKKLSLIGIDVQNVSNTNIISTLSITAPISGVISDLNVVKGSYLNATSPAMTLTNTDHKHAEVKILEKDFAKIKLGQKVWLSLQESPDTKFEASIYMIDPLVDENRMINIHCHLKDEENKALVAGMYLNAQVLLGETEVMTLPEDAVIAIDGKNFVLVKEGSDLTFQQKIVTIGSKQNGAVEIINKNDFASNAEFLTKGAYYLIMGE